MQVLNRLREVVSLPLPILVLIATCDLCTLDFPAGQPALRTGSVGTTSATAALLDPEAYRLNRDSATAQVLLMNVMGTHSYHAQLRC